MSPQLDSRSAPEMCRWLRFKTQPNARPSSWTEAVCVRLSELKRVVTPVKDCMGCRYWEPPRNM